MLEIKDPPFVLGTLQDGSLALKIVDGFEWTKDTQECITLSAAQWRFIAMGCRAFKQKAGNRLVTCALCTKFLFNTYTRSCENETEICPIAKSTGVLGCNNTFLASYINSNTWEESAIAAETFADWVGKLKPVPREHEFKGFCVGKSHDGYVGVSLEPFKNGVSLKADIHREANILLSIDKNGVHLWKNIYSQVPFAKLLSTEGTLKTCEMDIMNEEEK